MQKCFFKLTSFLSDLTESRNFALWFPFALFRPVDCHSAAYVKIVYSFASVPVQSIRISIHLLLQFITATDNFPDLEEVGFLLRFYRPSAVLLGAVVFAFLPQSCCTICLLLITEGQNNYKLKARKGKGFSSVSLPPKRKYHM